MAALEKLTERGSPVEWILRMKVRALALIVLVPLALSAQPATVIIVRHAEKASQTDADPVLSDAGIQRAKDLAAALADAHVSTVITTQLQRTRLTAAPAVDAQKPMTIVVPTTSATHVADVVAAIMA